MSLRLETPSPQEILQLRNKHHTEMDCQIVHYSIHRRPGWTKTYCLKKDLKPIALASVAIAGPWEGKPTIFEFYVEPYYRDRSAEFFKTIVKTGNVEFMEVQSNLVQELKRFAYQLNSVPCARCSPNNIASRKTLEKAGFVPYGNILTGSLIQTF